MSPNNTSSVSAVNTTLNFSASVVLKGASHVTVRANYAKGSTPSVEALTSAAERLMPGQFICIRVDKPYVTSAYAIVRLNGYWTNPTTPTAMAVKAKALSLGVVVTTDENEPSQSLPQPKRQITTGTALTTEQSDAVVAMLTKLADGALSTSVWTYLRSPNADVAGAIARLSVIVAERFPVAKTTTRKARQPKTA